MRFDKNRVELRRLEVQVHYHAAFLFWNLRGILAEKWAHGPHFGGYENQPEQVVLVPPNPLPPDIAGMYGLKASLFNWERPDEAEGIRLAKQWLSECLEVLQPRNVVRVYTKVFHHYPLNEREARNVAETMLSRYEGIGAFMPNQAGAVSYPGLSFQSDVPSDNGTIFSTGVYGIYRKSQGQNLFSVQRENDPEWALGLQVDRNLALESPTTWQASRSMIADELDAVLSDAKQARENTLVWDIGNA